jgi:hypothetical protein
MLYARGRCGESSPGMAVEAAFPVKSTEDRLSIMTSPFKINIMDFQLSWWASTSTRVNRHRSRGESCEQS